MSGVMKKPEDYLKEQHISEWVLEYLSGMLQPDGISGDYKQRILNAIKLAQIDAIDATIKLCAEKATTMDDPRSYCGNTGSEYPPDTIVINQSILNLEQHDELLKQQVPTKHVKLVR